MLYRIYLEQRLDKQASVIKTIRELTDNFTILQGRAYFGDEHRPCWIIEINHEGLWPIGDFESCIDKLKKVLNMPHILVTKTKIERVLY